MFNLRRLLMVKPPLSFANTYPCSKRAQTGLFRAGICQIYSHKSFSSTADKVKGAAGQDQARKRKVDLFPWVMLATGVFGFTYL